jgi:hypothetical protein
MVEDIEDMLEAELPSGIDTPDVLSRLETEMNSQLSDDRQVSF